MIQLKNRLTNYKEFTIPLKEKQVKNKAHAVWIAVFRFAIVVVL